MIGEKFAWEALLKYIIPSLLKPEINMTKSTNCVNVYFTWKVDKHELSYFY